MRSTSVCLDIYRKHMLRYRKPGSRSHLTAIPAAHFLKQFNHSVYLCFLRNSASNHIGLLFTVHSCKLLQNEISFSPSETCWTSCFVTNCSRVIRAQPRRAQTCQSLNQKHTTYFLPGDSIKLSIFCQLVQFTKVLLSFLKPVHFSYD